MLDALRRLFGREKPADPALWHRWEPLRPVRLTNGQWSAPIGTIWRRKHDGRWEYRQDEATDEEIADNAR